MIYTKSQEAFYMAKNTQVCSVVYFVFIITKNTSDGFCQIRTLFDSVEKVHPYKIYESKTIKDQWFTHLPDPARPEKRRKVKCMGYDNICKVVIDFYRDRYHMDITLGELFDDWARFRRDETAAKTDTVRRDVSLWRTHCEMVNVDGHILRDTKVTAVTSKLLQHFFRGLTKDRAYTRQSICNIRGVFSGMLRFAMDREIITSNPILAVDFKHLAYKPKQNK